ncbi:MAG: ABC transporter substrate-binding protein [Lysobacterales bacterium]|nr:MAG: ABC transporter substrate-binding protein [Xanthomonadales bacterium]
MISTAAAGPKKDKYLYLTGSTPHFFAPVTAVEKGFCKDMGLNVEIKKFTSGGVAAQSFIANQGDFLDSGDWPAVRTWLLTDGKDDPIVGLAQDAHYGDLSVVVARANIKSGKDLKGKKIGVWLGTTSEFFAALYLDRNGVALNEVEFVNVKPAEMVPALDTGDLDAYVIWQPFGWKSLEVSGDKVHILSTAKGYFTEYVLISTRKSILDNDPDAAKIMIECIKKGADYAAKNPQDAANIVGEFFKVPADKVLEMINVITPQANNTVQMRTDLDKLNNFMISKEKSSKKIDWNKHFDNRGLMSVSPSMVE